jgi:hypothetical protein
LITFNPAGEPLLTTQGGQVYAPTDLAHEIGHAVLANTGDLRGDPWLNTGLEESEWQTTHFENQVRSEMRLPLRTYYKKLKEHNPTTGEDDYYPDGPRLIKKGHFSVYVPNYDYKKENPPSK